MTDKSLPHFNGPEYDSRIDHARLSNQHVRIRDLMLDGQWRTLGEIANETGYKEASISAQLRHLRKERFGSYKVDRRARGDRSRGLFEYRVSREGVVDSVPTPGIGESQEQSEDDGDVRRLVSEHDGSRS